LKPPVVDKPRQSNLLHPCPELSPHQGKTGVDVTATLLRWAGEYNACAARHNALIEALKDQEK
jgi:hypothetical protein